MKALALCSILFWGLLQCGAQLPNQLTDPQYFIPKVNVDPIFTSILLEGAPNYFQTDIVSDGEGHHYVTVKDGRVTYYLLDNKGNTVRSYSGFPANSSHPAITSYYHAQGLVTRQHVVLQNGTNLELYRSTNGGGNWSFVDSRSIFGNLVGTDAFEDNKGVHIAYGSDGTGGGVRYHLRRRSPDEWAVEFPDYVTTSVSTTTYNTPSIVASTESVHVYFGGTVSDPRGLYSMAFNSPAWALKGLNFHRRPGTAIVYSNKLGVFPWYHVAGSCNQCLAFDYRNLLNAPDWTETVINPSVEGLDYGWKPHAVGYGSQGYLAYSSIVAPYQTRYYTIGGTHIPINFGATGSAPVVGANASGVDVIWKTTSGVNTGKATFRRRPIGVQGTLQGDHSFTDTNWVIGTAIVPSGSDLRLKDASVTFVWGQHNGGGPGKLSISAGASLVLEGNAKLILESPTQTGTQGGQLELPSGYAFVIPSSAQLIAKAGSKITFGSGASLVSYGKVMMSGSAARKVELIGTPNWSGMSLSGSGSSGSKLEYVKISGVTSTGGSALRECPYYSWQFAGDAILGKL